MASGLQCPGCGHVHPAGLPEIARGDATFRCYGCYRTLSVPDGWTGRPAPPPPAPPLGGDAPFGAGTRDARSARLRGRREGRAGALTGAGAGAPGGAAPGDAPPQMIPPSTRRSGAYGTSAPATGWSETDAATRATDGWKGAAGAGTAGAPAPGTAGNRRAAGRPGEPSGGRVGAAPLGWAAPRAADTSMPTGVRAAVWAAAFVVGLVIAAFVLRKVGLLDVDTVIDLYAGSGPGRFAILLLLLPLWALVSATVAHLSLEALTRRRRPDVSAADHAAETSTVR